ncbi:MAG: hypothetical protein LYZ69_06720 [Nitrososphaerales archaeon]|nr:hypothetical protein [Nitrososphaerales archaeon]
MKSSKGAAAVLFAASLLLGAVLGFLGQYEIVQHLAYSTHLAIDWAMLAVTYPLTLLVFYSLGRRHLLPFGVGLSVLAIYGGALLGNALGRTLSFAFPPNHSFTIPFSFVYVLSVLSSFSFLFVAFSGLALPSLSRAVARPPKTQSRGSIAVTLVALGFSLVGGFSFGAFPLYFFSFPGLQVPTLFFLLEVSASPPVQLAVFYYLGRRIPVDGRPFRYLGLLFVGAYVGSIAGVVMSVALFGQSFWTLPAGQTGVTISNGVVYQNTPYSLLFILESMNPIQSLAFLFSSFFAMSISRVHAHAGEVPDETKITDGQKPWT